MHQAGRIDRFTLAVLCIALLAAGLTFWWLQEEGPQADPHREEQAQTPVGVQPGDPEALPASQDPVSQPVPEQVPEPGSAAITIREAQPTPGLQPPPGASVSLTLSAPGSGVPGETPLPALPAEALAGLRGRVTDSGGRPLEGVRVRSSYGHQLGDGGGIGFDLVQLEALAGKAPQLAAVESVTDATGHFEILGLDPRRSPTLVVDPPEGFLRKRQKAPSLRKGEVVDAGTIRLERPGSIKGTVTDAEGRPLLGVVVRLGEPLPDGVQLFHAEDGGGASFAMVQLEVVADSVVEQDAPDEAPMVAPSFPGVTTTDEAGRFELTDVRPGQHLVSGRLRGYRDAKLEPVEVQESTTTGPILLVMAQPLQLLVRVRDREGMPVEGARVRAGTGRMGGFSFYEAAPGRGPNSGTTDGAGEVRFGELNDLEIALNVSAEGFARHESRLRLSSEGANLREVTLQPAGALQGRVLDHQGEPLAGAQLRLRLLGESPSLEHGLGAPERSAADGRFLLSGLRPGPHELEVSHEGAEDATFGPFAVEEAGLLDVGDLRLNAAGAIAVRVVDGGGEPVEGASVSLGMNSDYSMISYASDGGGLFVSGGGPSTTSDADGRALLAGVEPGVHTIRARHSEQGEGYADRVEVGSGSTVEVEIRLGEAGRVEGVARQADGEPYANLDLGLYREDAGMMATANGRADAQGRFVFEEVVPGLYHLGRGVGNQEQGPVFEVRDGATTWQDFQEAARLQIAGEVLQAGGDALTGVAISVGIMRPEADGGWAVRWPSAEDYSDERGQFSLKEIAARDGLGLQVTVSAERRYVFPLDSLGPTFDRLQLRLPADGDGTGTLEVLLLDTLQQAAPGARLIVSHRDLQPGRPAFRRELAADAEGRVALQQLEAGSYRLEALLPGAALEVRDIELPSGGAQVVQITLHPIGHLLFNVRSAAGVEGGLTIEATLDGEPEATRVRSGQLGETLTFENLRLGSEYRFEIRAPGHVPHVESWLVRPADATPVEVQLAAGN